MWSRSICYFFFFFFFFFFIPSFHLGLQRVKESLILCQICQLQNVTLNYPSAKNNPELDGVWLKAMYHRIRNYDLFECIIYLQRRRQWPTTPWYRPTVLGIRFTVLWDDSKTTTIQVTHSAPTSVFYTTKVKVKLTLNSPWTPRGELEV